MKLDINLAELSDIKGISEIENEFFSFPHTEEQIKFEIEDGNHIVITCKNNTELIGYCIMTVIIDEAFISNIAVKKAYQNNGIASQIMEYILNYLKSISVSSLSLEVRESNIAAISLYKKYGFEIESILEGYYSKPKENAYIMTNRRIS